MNRQQHSECELSRAGVLPMRGPLQIVLAMLVGGVATANPQAGLAGPNLDRPGRWDGAVQVVGYRPVRRDGRNTGKPNLQGGKHPPRQVLIQQQLHAALTNLISCASRVAAYARQLRMSSIRSSG